MMVSIWEQSEIWRTKDGREIPIAELTDSHLANVIAMLERSPVLPKIAAALALQTAGAIGAYLDSDPPDGAYDAASSELNMLLDDMENLRHIPVYSALVKERAQRKDAA